MNDPTDQSPQGETDAQLARVLRLAPRVPEVSAERRAAAFERVHEDWRAATSRPARRWTPLRAVPSRGALAAGLAAMLVATTLWVGRAAVPAGDEIAVAMTVSGAELAVGGAGWFDRWRSPAQALHAGTALHAADVLTTGPASVALLRVGPVLTLRVAPQSQLRFDGVDRVTLLRGQVYVDSHSGSGVATALTVATPLGDVQHVGTRYLVRAGAAAIEVGVREGRVRLSGVEPGVAAEAVAGERLRLAADADAIERSVLAGNDAAYAWLAEIPAPIDIEGQTLATFLQWYAAETGRTVVLGSGEQAAPLGSVRLSGSVAGLTPEQALETVAAVADLSVSVATGVVQVDSAGR
jgi:ferric-dicitrate binding protein FerR (iron transport regulator)